MPNNQRAVQAGTRWCTCVFLPGWSWSRGNREHGKSIMVVYLPTTPDVDIDSNLEPFPRYERVNLNLVSWPGLTGLIIYSRATSSAILDMKKNLRFLSLRISSCGSTYLWLWKFRSEAIVVWIQFRTDQNTCISEAVWPISYGPYDARNIWYWLIY